MLHDLIPSKGFTLIELLIVFSILAIISTIGIAAFSGYSQSQNLRNASLTLKTLLQQARTDAAAQVNTSVCANTFQGYAVQLCCSAGGLGCPNCTTGNDYEIDIVCSNASGPTYATVANTGGKFPSGVSINTTSTTQRSFQFIPLSGGVTSGGTIVLNGANSTQQAITVTGTGVIQ